MNDIQTYKTKQEAQAVADQLGSGIYYLEQGEYARPDYSVLTSNEDSYYIYRKVHFYDNALYASKSGPVTSEEVAMA